MSFTFYIRRDLTHFEHVQNLSFAISSHTRIQVLDDCINPFLSQTHLKLMKIRITIDFPTHEFSEDFLKMRQWTDFDTIVDQRFPHLTDIEFILRLNESNWSETGYMRGYLDMPVMFSPELKRLMPRSEEKGILRITIPSRTDVLPYYRVS
jgi:hypothetical protein